MREEVGGRSGARAQWFSGGPPFLGASLSVGGSLSVRFAIVSAAQTSENDDETNFFRFVLRRQFSFYVKVIFFSILGRLTVSSLCFHFQSLYFNH